MEAVERKLVMLVDDEEDIRDVLAIAIDDMGYDVIKAENGNMAMELFRKHQPVIVLTDIKMPGMDGIEVLQKIKAENPYTEVIMITGHGDTNIAIKSLKYKAVDFITKPISNDALEIALNRAKEKIIARHQLKKYTENLEKLVCEKTILQDNLTSLGLMIGSVSHGLKGLLTKLDGGLYIMESAIEKQDNDQLKEGMDILKLTIDRVKKKIFDILYYSKKREMKIENINTLAFANDIVDIADEKALPHNIKITRYFDDAPVEFKADPEYLSSALINILDNAVDACIEDNAQKKEHNISFTIKQDENNINFEIYDNGIGMDADTRDKIFNLFFSSKQSKGTGFGLFISKNIVHQHGGFINVKSAKGKGTCINIRLPKEPKQVTCASSSF